MQNWKDLFPKENKYFETDKGILYNGNIFHLLPQFPPNSVDLIITSPPYNVGIDYGVYKDNLPLQDYIQLMKSFLLFSKSILKNDGRIIINVLMDAKTIDGVRFSPIAEFYKLFQDTGLSFFTIIRLEEKQPHRVKHTAWGSYRSQSAPYIYNPEEYAIIGYKKQWKKINCEKDEISKELFIELVSGRWKYFPETKKWTQANFSEDFPYKAMKILSCKNDIILDPFIGSGTTGVVAEKLNRKWIGIELNPEYCEIAKNRILKNNQKLF